MKKRMLPVLALTCALVLAGCGDSLAAGSEETYCGTVADLAMSVVREGGRESRAYVGLTLEDGTEMLFWLPRGYTAGDVSVGDSVRVDSALEVGSGLLVATDITILKEAEYGTE